ncbi:MAG: hydrogenase maturation nickel metallochaperone HypA [Candidatus Sumerlaeota bacterium]|nr:hydrogenase maturation nickel metallochaperone HypA [Candidatus Sumerlaeota bacterium]
MHELGLARDLSEIIFRKASGNNLKKIRKIVLRLGEASGVDEAHLRHSFTDHIFPGTMAEGAELVFIYEPLKAACRKCNKEVQQAEEFLLSCPFCGSYDVVITHGKDILLETIEGE